MDNMVDKCKYGNNSKENTTENNLNYRVIEIPQGLIKGCKSKTMYDTKYFSFEGIPYAKPPINALRFKAPIPADGWCGIRDCTHFNIKPIQKNSFGVIEGSEDCLYLNIYSKKVGRSETPLPVMVWIHGGGFSSGNCTKEKYGPDYFMEENIVLVTFNYRLSVFGFLSLADPSLNIPGNAGLKDQVLALKWVKNNIEWFSGDKNNITVFGDNAGGASVHFLISTNATRNLFHKAICQSGCMLNNWAFNKEVVHLAHPLACLKGYEGLENEADVLYYLQNLPADDLVVIDKLEDKVKSKFTFYAFVPCQEPYESEGAIITRPLLEMLKDSWGNEIPVIFGGVSFEGLIMYPRLNKIKQIINSSANNPEFLLPKDLPLNKIPNNILQSNLSNLMTIHFGENSLSDDINELNILDYFSYRLFWHAFHRVIRARELYAQGATYQYRFDFDSPKFNQHRKLFCGNKISKGVAHADDIDYLFFNVSSCKLSKTSREYLTMQRMVKIWTVFARTGNPNCKFIRHWEDVRTAGSLKWLNIADELIFQQIPPDVQNRLAAWNNLYGDNLLQS